MKIIYFIIHHFFRPIWSTLINIPVNIYLLILFLSLKHNREAWRSNREKWKKIKTIEDLKNHFKNDYEYTSDGLMGIFDRDNTALEYFSRWGDCDDAARWGVRALRRAGIKADRYLLWGKGRGLMEKIKNQHYVIIAKSHGFYVLVNYWKSYTGDTPGEVIARPDPGYTGFIKCLY